MLIVGVGDVEQALPDLLRRVGGVGGRRREGGAITQERRYGGALAVPAGRMRPAGTHSSQEEAQPV